MLVLTPPSILQDHNPTLWFSENGQRLGTYVGHNGSVNTCDVSSESPHGHLECLNALHVRKRLPQHSGTLSGWQGWRS